VDVDTVTKGAAIVPIAVTLNERTAVTLWAPPWRDPATGDMWQGLLGFGDKVMLFADPSALRAFLDTGAPTDLSDHPDWHRVTARTAHDLRPTPEYTFDMDSIFTLAADDPTPGTVTEVAKLLYLASAIAECCDDEDTLDLLTTDPGFAPFTTRVIPTDPEELAYEWDELGESILRCWDDVSIVLASCLTYVADPISTVMFGAPGFAKQAAPWEVIRPAYVRAPVVTIAETQPGISGMAVTSFVLAMLGISLFAILFGHAARADIRRTGKSADGLAVAGLVLGYLEIVGLLIAIGSLHG
jgi:hypothetical protein